MEPHAGLKEAATYMQKHKIGCLPVLRHNKLVGIITDSDFVAIAINLLEIQEEVEPTDEGGASSIRGLGWYEFSCSPAHCRSLP